MSTATQFQFDLLEVARLLAKEKGISEGYWTIGVKFNFTALNAGPSKDAVRPSAVVSVELLALTKVDRGDQPLTLDASKL